MKGISPLIAAVLLIAFTMAIAGIMATWATQFVREQTSTIKSQSNCIGALDVSIPTFSNTTISLTVYNKDTKINLTNLKAYVEYADPLKNKEYVLKDYNVTDPLPPGGRSWAIIETNDTTVPRSIEVVASNCPDYPARVNF